MIDPSTESAILALNLTAFMDHPTHFMFPGIAKAIVPLLIKLLKESTIVLLPFLLGGE